MFIDLRLVILSRYQISKPPNKNNIKHRICFIFSTTAFCFLYSFYFKKDSEIDIMSALLININKSTILSCLFTFIVNSLLFLGPLYQEYISNSLNLECFQYEKWIFLRLAIFVNYMRNI